jgi:hypothetical protein
MTPEYRLLLQVALFLCLLVVILAPFEMYVEGFSVPMLVGGVLSLIISFRLLSQLRLRLVRATFILPPDRIEDHVAQAMAAIGFTVEPHSQIGQSFTFRALGSRLVVTKTASGIEVTGTSGLIDRLAKELGIIPQKDASARLENGNRAADCSEPT